MNALSVIMNGVLSRLEYSIFPIVSSSLYDDINRMVAPQIDKMGELSPLQIQIVIEAIIQRYKNASIKKYEPVGVNAALTTGENLVQSSLQSHHHAGLKRGAAGFDRIEEITNMMNKSNIVKVITTPHRIIINGDIHEVPRSKIEINELSNLLTRVLMDDVVNDYEIMTALDGVYPSWYPVYASIKAIPMSALKKKWIRIYINKDMMYKYRIPLSVFSMIIMENIGEGTYVLYPPSQIGTYIDVHMNLVSDADYYLKLADIQSLLVGGISTVESATPIPENLLTNLRVYEVNNVTGVNGCDKVYELVSSAPAFVPPFAWKRMIEAMIPDAQIIGDTGKRFCSSYSLSEVREMILSPPLIYADILDTREEVIQDEERMIHITFKQEIVNKYPYLEHADLSDRYFASDADANRFLLEIMVEYHFFWYIEAICERVQDLYILPEVDSTRTYTTSPLDCRDSLGYMAMRSMIYREFKDNIGVNPIHVKVIINNMTLYKEPVSIRRQSVRNDKSEWITFTTFEDVLKYITFAAFVGEEDHMQSVSSHVLTGRPIEIGRGGINLPKITKDNPTGNSYLEMKRREQNKTKATRGRRALPRKS